MTIAREEMDAWRALAKSARNPEHPILRLTEEVSALQQELANLSRGPEVEAEAAAFERKDVTDVIDLLIARAGKSGPQPPLSSVTAAVHYLLRVHDAAALVAKAHCSAESLVKPLAALCDALIDEEPDAT